MAKRANSYSGAMVMTWKTGENPSNGAPPKVDTQFKTLLNLRHQRANVKITHVCCEISVVASPDPGMKLS